MASEKNKCVCNSEQTIITINEETMTFLDGTTVSFPFEEVKTDDLEIEPIKN